jgi:hypothetical protein
MAVLAVVVTAVVVATTRWLALAILLQLHLLRVIMVAQVEYLMLAVVVVALRQ